MSQLSLPMQAVALALAETTAPAGRSLKASGARTLSELTSVLDGMSPWVQRIYPRLLHALDAFARARAGRGFAELSLEERNRMLRDSEQLPFGSLGLNGMLTPLRVARARELWAAAERTQSLPLHVERARSWQRAVDACSFGAAETLEADVVVVGTGAGGAAVAHALAQRGHAVLMLEEGNLFTRQDFGGDVLARRRKLYRPFTFTFGNTVIPVPTGVSVGGTTTINSGTCFRTPAAVLRRLRGEHGLTDLDEAELEPYFRRVEAMLEVASTPLQLTSASERMIARGADALGYAHMPLLRNAPGCDGQSECCFGCPTDAKRSSLVSYVPAALQAGAMLVYRAAVERILHEHGRAVGVLAMSRGQDGPVRRFEVRAKAVVLACGTFGTPLLLLKNGLCNGSGELGKHLTLHPASHAWARFDHALEGASGVPQGHAVELPGEDGIRIEGGMPPRELAAATLTAWGGELTQLLEDFDKLAFCGFMVRDDASEGRVRLTRAGTARVTYWLGASDLRRVQLGQVALAKLFLAAGARTVYPGMFHGRFARIRSVQEVEQLEQARLHAHDFALSAFHPLGTCRMGKDPRRSVVGPTHETHELERLFICDGSAVPGPLGVNPQVTIMALSERASTFIERRLETTVPALGPAALPPRPAANTNLAAAHPQMLAKRLEAVRRRLTFAEIMAGTCHSCDEARKPHRVVLNVKACGALDTLLSDLGHDGSRFALTGHVDIGGIVAQAPCLGTLTMQPRRLARALVYELSFTDEAGVDWSLYGEKQLDHGRLLRGLTTLHSELRRGASPEPALQGLLHFELEQLWPWLRSFRVA